ncbi:hypothetical protein [uncultured Fibrella sp.]|uniref:hypothetical protein n=1 Tax=uncultured Fibrella sp. TaxID=1284596 RepID=UPI0035C9B747
MTATDSIYWPYFQALALGIEGVTTVRLSDGDRMERLISASVSEKIYPAVFSMRPKYRILDTGAEQFYAVFEITFYVFCQSEVSNEASQDAAFNQAETIALAVLHQLKQDHLTTATVDFDYGSAGLEPVSMMTIDSTQGYEVKLKLTMSAQPLFERL